MRGGLSISVLRVTIAETVIIYGAIPFGALALLGLMTMLRKPTKTAKYKPGRPWEHEPVWWSANPEGLPDRVDNNSLAAPGTDVIGGGARATW